LAIEKSKIGEGIIFETTPTQSLAVGLGYYITGLSLGALPLANSRGKHHNKTKNKTTMSLYLNRNLVEKARNYSLNL